MQPRLYIPYSKIDFVLSAAGGSLRKKKRRLTEAEERNKAPCRRAPAEG
jgi:hypothetical protein